MQCSNHPFLTRPCKFVLLLQTIPPGGVWYALYNQVFSKSWNQKKTQIVIGEMLAVMAAFLFFPQAFHKTSNICFVDNIGVICSVVKGDSRPADLANLVQALHFRMADLESLVWWEYVPSASNLSDGGSRVGTACELAEAAGIELVHKDFPNLPKSFPKASPSSFVDWWRAQ